MLSPSCSNDLILIQTLKMIFLNNRSNCTGAKFNRLGAGNKCCSVQPDLYSLVLLNPEVDLSAI